MQAVSKRILVALVLAPMLLTVCVGCDDDRRVLEDQYDPTDYDALAEQPGLLYGFTTLGGYGDAAGNVFVTAVDESDDAAAETVESDQGGYFEIELVPGSYRIYATGFQQTGLGPAECGDAVFGIVIEPDEGVQQDLHLVCEDLD